jgi:hypothetical protein
MGLRGAAKASRGREWDIRPFSVRTDICGDGGQPI